MFSQASRSSHAQLCLVFVMSIVALGSACFIRNCPVGGKRSLEQMPDIPSQRKCSSCGPLNLGQCVGPNICCGSEIGCFINTLESAPCRRENDIPTPCTIDGERCGEEHDGYCMTDSVCCTDEHCHMTAECHQPNHKDAFSEVSPKTLQYLKQLLQGRTIGRR